MCNESRILKENFEAKVEVGGCHTLHEGHCAIITAAGVIATCAARTRGCLARASAFLLDTGSTHAGLVRHGATHA